MRAVNIQYAKTHLSRLVDEAEAGEHIVIAKAGRRCVRLVPVTADDEPRELGRLRGRVRVARDFDAPVAEIETLFGLGAAPRATSSRKKRRRPPSSRP